MISGLGPVVRYELITTARRGRFYMVRAVYGLSLLAMLLSQFQDFERHHPAGGTAEQIQTSERTTGQNIANGGGY